MKGYNLCHKGACLNDEHMIISTYEPSKMLIYNAKEVIADRDYCKRNGITYVANPVPIRTIENAHGLSRRSLYMAGPNRLVFADQVVQNTLRRPRSQEEIYEGAVRCLDFWMA